MMSNNNILISAVGAVLVAGLGIFAWWALSAPRPAVQPQNNSPQYYGGNNQSSISTSPPVQAKPVKLPDIDAAYAALFQNLAAQKADFVRSSASSTGDRGDIYKLYAKDAAAAQKMFANPVDPSIGVALADIDDDGVAEALVYEDLPGFCSSAGCPLDIYKKNKTKWGLLYSALVAGPVGVANTNTNGYRDLFLTVQGDVGYQGKVVRFVWDGKSYQPQGTVALWDGDGFTQ